MDWGTPILTATFEGSTLDRTLFDVEQDCWGGGNGGAGAGAGLSLGVPGSGTAVRLAVGARQACSGGVVVLHPLPTSADVLPPLPCCAALLQVSTSATSTGQRTCGWKTGGW